MHVEPDDLHRVFPVGEEHELNIEAIPRRPSIVCDNSSMRCAATAMLGAASGQRNGSSPIRVSGVHSGSASSATAIMVMTSMEEGRRYDAGGVLAGCAVQRPPKD